ncbi:MAG: thiamine diphosphokinase [Chlorobi bacterium]|nr:thiamine diphosphokinase [Chlorobiota bacterium]
MQTVILANGAFPESEKLLKLLDNAKKIVCCDGAVNKLIDSGRIPNVIIGDLDSVRPELKKKYADIIIRIPDQNTNDLTKAVKWCVSNNYTDIIILGATGNREDHAIGNISLLSEYAKMADIKMLTDYGEFIAINKTTTFHSFTGQQVSIFSLCAQLEISSENLKYPLHNLKLSAWWMGTLNESTSDSFTISFKEGGEVIVYLLDKE